MLLEIGEKFNAVPFASMAIDCSTETASTSNDRGGRGGEEGGREGAGWRVKEGTVS